MPLRFSALFAALFALAALALTAGSAGASPARVEAQAAKGCHVNPTSHKYGTTYLFSLRVSHVSCAGGVRVVKAFNACRHHHGKAGHCGHALGYGCSEHRFAKIGTEYDSNVRCKKGGKLVRFHYEQFT